MSEWQILNRIRVKECGKARGVKTSVCSKECFFVDFVNNLKNCLFHHQDSTCDTCGHN